MQSSRSNSNIIIGIALLLSSVGCSSSFQPVTGAAKITALASHPLLTSHTQASAEPSPSPSPSTCSNDGLQQTCPTPTPSPSTPTSMPASTICSSDDTANIGSNIKSSTALRVQLVAANGQVACEYTDNSVRDGIINEKNVILPGNLASSCPTLTAGTYGLRLKNGASGSMISTDVPSNAQVTNEAALISSGGTFGFGVAPALAVPFYNFYYGVPNDPQVTVTVDVAGGKHVARAENSTSFSVLYDINPMSEEGTGSSSECGLAASPLLIQIISGQETPQLIDLRAPLSGIRFDILGDNSYPTAHTPRQISWLTPVSAIHNYFLVLPDDRGEVTGIDQMFGNNTRGPDGQMAANGYEALRKFDGRKADGSYDAKSRDGKITKDDAVFSKLRLWSDTNGDGIVQPGELHSLDELSVVSIDLNYDANYSETDRYGNQIKMKSAAVTKDGLSHVVYDIWFRIVD